MSMGPDFIAATIFAVLVLGGMAIAWWGNR